MLIKPGDLMMIVNVPDQPPWIRKLAGKRCIVIRNLTQADGVTSSPSMWDVLVDDYTIRVHALDLSRDIM